VFDFQARKLDPPENEIVNAANRIYAELEILQLVDF
jgi:hypothetical protein